MKPEKPTRADYTFGGWFKDDGCTKAWNFDTDVAEWDITLYAKWTPESDCSTGAGAFGMAAVAVCGIATRRRMLKK